MANKPKTDSPVAVISNKKLSRSFTYDNEYDVYRCPYISKKELLSVISKSIMEVTPMSEPLTVTFEGIQEHNTDLKGNQR